MECSLLFACKYTHKSIGRIRLLTRISNQNAAARQLIWSRAEQQPARRREHFRARILICAEQTAAVVSQSVWTIWFCVCSSRRRQRCRQGQAAAGRTGWEVKKDNECQRALGARRSSQVADDLPLPFTFHLHWRHARRRSSDCLLAYYLLSRARATGMDRDVGRTESPLSFFLIAGCCWAPFIYIRSACFILLPLSAAARLLCPPIFHINPFTCPARALSLALIKSKCYGARGII